MKNMDSKSLFSALDDPVICSDAFWDLLKDTTNIVPLNIRNPKCLPKREKPLSYHRKVLKSAGTVSVDKFEEIQGKEYDSEEEQLNSIIETFEIHDFERKNLKPEDQLLMKDGNGNLGWSQDIGILCKIPAELRNKSNIRYIFRDLALTGLKIEEIDEEMEWFPNLQRLDLSENQIPVLQHLPQTLTNLIVFDNVGLSTFSTALHLPNLLQLGLAYNEFETLDILPEVCPNLINLDLAFNRITNLRSVTGALGRLPRLIHLNLNGNPVSLMRIYRPNIVFYFPNLESLDELTVDKTERFLSSEEEDILDPLGDATLDYNDDARKKNLGVTHGRSTKKALTGRQKILAARYVQRWYRSRIVGKVAKVLISLLSNARTTLKTSFVIEVRSLRFPEAILAVESGKGKKIPKPKPSIVKDSKPVIRSLNSSDYPEDDVDMDHEEGFPRLYLALNCPTNPDRVLESRHMLIAPEIEFEYRRKLDVVIGNSLRDALHFGNLEVKLYHEDQFYKGTESVKSGVSVDEGDYELQTTLLSSANVSLRKMLLAETARDYKGMPRIEKDLKIKIDYPILGEVKEDEDLNDEYNVAYLSLSVALNVTKWRNNEEILFRQPSV